MYGYYKLRIRRTTEFKQNIHVLPEPFMAHVVQANKYL